MLCLTGWIAAPVAAAPIPLAEYFAGNSSVAWSPSLWGWYDPSYLEPPQPIDGYVSSVTGSAGGGVTAWQIHNPGITGIEPHYFFFLPATYTEQARTNGWNLQATAQLVEMGQGMASQGLAVTFEARYYEVAIDKNGSTLVASIRTGLDATTDFNLPASATGYHDYELRMAPGTETVSFLFDNQLVHSWTGVPEAPTHPNKFEFGSITDQGEGSMNFREAYSSILDTAPNPTEMGDYNGDGRVNLADYTLWRNSLGSTSQLAADGNGNQRIDSGDYTVWKSNLGQVVASSAVGEAAIPEPAAGTLVVLALVASAWKAKRAGMPNLANRPF